MYWTPSGERDADKAVRKRIAVLGAPLATTAAAGLSTLSAARGLTAHAGNGSDSPGITRSSPLPVASDDPLGVRASFPVTEELAYLNTASSGPLPVPVRDALHAYADEKMLRRNTRAGREAIASARSRFAGLFGADEDELAFLYATSGAENIIVSAMDWRAGDNVVVDELHFTTTFVLYRELERRAGIELRIIPSRDGVVTLDDFAAHTDRRTRLISVAWVSNRNGFRYDLPPLADLAHAHGAYLYADAIQAWGTFPTNLHEENVDFACGNGYKWLHADFGCAPFYVRREHLEWMTSDRFGHRQVAESLPGHQVPSEDERGEAGVRESGVWTGDRDECGVWSSSRGRRAGADRRAYAWDGGTVARGSPGAGDADVHSAGQSVRHRELLSRARS